MAKRRVARVGEQLRREITEILQREAKDPRVSAAVVTHVDVTADLYHARVYVTIGGDDDERRQALEGLAAASPFIRGELGRRLHLRRVPELRFELDRSLDHALHIERLLREALPDSTEPAGDGEPESRQRGAGPEEDE